VARKFVDNFKEGIIKGFAWSIGATLGFALVSTVLLGILKSAGGVPLVGSWVATIVEATADSLTTRTPIFPSQ
jgi:hypothetical protein